MHYIHVYIIVFIFRNFLPTKDKKSKFKTKVKKKTLNPEFNEVHILPTQKHFR